MEYVALIHVNAQSWASMPDDERAQVLERFEELGRAAEEAGIWRAGHQLASTATATTVRVRNGETLVTDGPYAEVKEALGGFFVLDCEDEEEALEWCARIPTAERGAIEVRAVHVDPAEVQL